MPYMVEEPIVIRQENYWQVTATCVRTPIGAAPYCDIEVTSTYCDENEVHHDPHVYPHTVRDQAFVTEMMSLTTGETMFAELATRVYARCKADGIIPANAVWIDS